jgi:ubiquitin-conjugating enzyme E2 J1
LFTLLRANLINPSVDHEELWQPAWGVRTGEFHQRHLIESDALNRGPILLAIIGLQGFFPLKGQAAMGIGALEAPPSERKRLAAL